MDVIKLSLGQAVAANRVVNAHASYGKAIRAAENLGVSVDLAPVDNQQEMDALRQELDARREARDRAEYERDDARAAVDVLRDKLQYQSAELATLRDAYNKIRDAQPAQTDFLKVTKFLEMLDDSRNGNTHEEIKHLLVLASDTQTRIPAIKEVRMHTGLSVKAAKALADLISNRKPV